MKKRFVVSVSLFFLIFVLSSAAHAFWNSGPSDEDVQNLIAERFQQGLPPEWTQGCPGKLDTLSFRKIERGNYNKKGAYWPFIVTLKGKARIEKIMQQKIMHSFHGKGTWTPH